MSTAAEQSSTCGGHKDDAEEPPVMLVPPRAILRIAEVMGHGAHKHGRYNWSQGIALSRLYSALMRHMLKWAAGEDADTDSGLSHLAHAGCNILMLLELSARRPDLDDRDPACKEAQQ